MSRSWRENSETAPSRGAGSLRCSNGWRFEWLLAAGKKAVAERLHLSWDETHGGSQECAVKRGLARRKAGPVPHIEMDEKLFTAIIIHSDQRMPFGHVYTQ